MRHRIHLPSHLLVVVAIDGVNVRDSRAASFVALIITTTACHFVRHAVNVSRSPVSDVISPLL